MYPFKFRFGYKKEEDFYLLRKTKCPAILAELGFMDNKEDYKRLNNEKYISSCVLSIVRFIISENLKE